MNLVRSLARAKGTSPEDLGGATSYGMNKLVQFLQEVRVELGKVSWPSRQQLVTYTGIVLGLSLFLAIFLGALDFGFVSLLNAFVLNR